MKKSFLILILIPIILTGCGEDRSGETSDANGNGLDENFRVEKDIFVDVETFTKLYYGIHPNAADLFLTLEELPTESAFEEGLDITGESFASAILSPDGKTVAISVKGKGNSYSALVDIETKEVEQLTILKKGYEPSALYWSLDGKYLISEDISLVPKPRRFLTLIGVADRGIFTPLDVTPANPDNDLIDVHSPVWSVDSTFAQFKVQLLPDGKETMWGIDISHPKITHLPK